MRENKTPQGGGLKWITGVLARNRLVIARCAGTVIVAPVAALYQLPNCDTSKAILLTVPQEVPPRYVTGRLGSFKYTKMHKRTQDLADNKRPVKKRTRGNSRHA